MVSVLVCSAVPSRAISLRAQLYFEVLLNTPAACNTLASVGIKL